VDADAPGARDAGPGRLGWGTVDDEVQIAYRLAQLERRVDAIMRHLGIAEPTIATTASARVQELARQGDKIHAIKQYREETGVGLAEAKAVVDNLF